MKLLAIDTSSSACSLALLHNEKITQSHEIAPMQQAKLILPRLEQLLQKANIALKELDAIAFGCGPGSFTGVRIAASVAQGLAYAADKPLISISSLAATAQAVYENLGWEKIIVAIDARIHEVYWATYAVQSGLATLVAQEKVDSPKNVTAEGEWSAAGNAWEVYAAEISFKPVQTDSHYLPMASAMLTLARAKFLRGELLSPAEAIPVYLRDNVAKKTPEQ